MKSVRQRKTNAIWFHLYVESNEQNKLTNKIFKNWQWEAFLNYQTIVQVSSPSHCTGKNISTLENLFSKVNSIKHDVNHLHKKTAMLSFQKQIYMRPKIFNISCIRYCLVLCRGLGWHLLKLRKEGKWLRHT